MSRPGIAVFRGRTSGAGIDRESAGQLSRQYGGTGGGGSSNMRPRETVVANLFTMMGLGSGSGICLSVL